MKLVYFIQAGEGGPIKIGTAGNMRTRLNALQTGSAEVLTLLATFEGGILEERKLHRELRSHRIHGEWFRPHEDVMRMVRLYQRKNSDGEPQPEFSDEDLILFLRRVGFAEVLRDTYEGLPEWRECIAIHAEVGLHVVEKWLELTIDPSDAAITKLAKKSLPIAEWQKLMEKIRIDAAMRGVSDIHVFFDMARQHGFVIPPAPKQQEESHA